MRIIGRFFLALYGFVLALFSVVIIALLSFIWTGKTTYEIIGEEIQYYFAYPFVIPTIIITFVGVFLVSIVLTIASSNKREKRNPIILKTESGDISISLDTFESIAISALKKISEAKDYNVRVKNVNPNVQVSVKLLATPEANIPELGKIVQTNTVEAIETATGVKVSNVRIKVDNIYTGFKSKVE